MSKVQRQSLHCVCEVQILCERIFLVLSQLPNVFNRGSITMLQFLSVEQLKFRVGNERVVIGLFGLYSVQVVLVSDIMDVLVYLIYVRVRLFLRFRVQQLVRPIDSFCLIL